MGTLILTDNPYALALARELQAVHGSIALMQSPGGTLEGVPEFSVKSAWRAIAAEHDLVISIHCKQLFPADLVRSIRCINVHPGLNPYNRGWYPQVFSIINGLPAGVTIHEMDDLLDHGPIIAQQALRIESWDTSGSVYLRLMALEREMVLRCYAQIRDGTYRAIAPTCEGNVNLRRDFASLCRIDLDETASFGAVIDRLRALSHADFWNAYFVDRAGRKVSVRIQLRPE